MQRWQLRIFISVGSLLGASYLALAQNVPSNASYNSNNKPVAWPSNSYITTYINTDTIPIGSLLYNTIVNRLQYSNNLVGTGVQYYSPSPISGCPTVTSCPLAPGPIQLFTASGLPDGYVGQNSLGWNSSPTSNPYQPEIYSTITIDSSKLITSTGDVSSGYASRIVSHEIMHDYGLGDAPDADPSQTLMSYQATPDDPYLTEPSFYDLGTSGGYLGSDNQIGGGGGSCGYICPAQGPPDE